MAQSQASHLRVNSSGPSVAAGRHTALKFLWAWSLVLLPAAESLGATDLWKNAKIMPRNDQSWLMVGSEYRGGVRDVSWPATVARREGQWLWISDRSGFRPGSVEGWIKIDDVLKQADAQDYYSQQLQTAPSGVLYWLRGITWETSGDKDVAQIDYQQAVKLDDTLADAHVRLGRIEAEEGQARTLWEAHFTRASQLRPNSPQVHFAWAEALRTKFSGDERPGSAQPDEKTGGQAADLKQGHHKPSASNEKFQCFCDARDMFTFAKKCDPSWPYTHLGYGQLLLANAQATTKEKLHELTKANLDEIRLDGKSKDQLDDATRKTVEADLAKAVAEFNEAIQWNPQAVDAYRDRGEAYRLQSQLSSALRSADKACKMLDYRASYSLQVLAAVYYDSSLADKDPSKIEKAITYATRAAQFAQNDKGQRFKHDRDFYIEQLGKQPNTALRSPGAMLTEELPRRGSFDDANSTGKQTGPGGISFPPAPSQGPGRSGISEDTAKFSGSSAVVEPAPAGAATGTETISAARGLKKTYYAIPDLIPQPLGGIRD